MSRAFVKDDAPEGEVLVPPRAPLPPGVPNYVTPAGLRLLREEMKSLEAERGKLSAKGKEDGDRARQLAILNQRISDLRARISRSKLVDPTSQPEGEVRFGAEVTVRVLTGPDAGQDRLFSIVGVDEAQGRPGAVAFLAPIARVLVGHSLGKEVLLTTPRGEERLQITSIRYPLE